jgi:hypothetical protein
MVVSSIFALRENALSALPSTNGARVMLSAPPAITSCASPALMLRAARPTASRLEPQRRFTVLAGTSIGNPASNTAMRPRLRLSSPAWFAQPYSTSSTAAQSTFGLRAISAFSGSAARSSARTLANAPP